MRKATMSLLDKQRLTANITTTTTSTTAAAAMTTTNTTALAATMPTPQQQQQHQLQQQQQEDYTSEHFEIDRQIRENAINNVSATITSIRSNVTRVLYMYFQNVSDEFGYGAANEHDHQHQQYHHHHQQQHRYQYDDGNELTSFEPATTAKIATTLTTRTTTAAAATATATTTSKMSSLTPSITNALTQMTQVTRDTATNVINRATNAVNAAIETATTATTATAATIVNKMPTATTFHMLPTLNATATAATTAAAAAPTTATTASSTAAAAAITASATSAATTTAATATGTLLTTTPTITYPSYRLAIANYDNCSALFANYTQPQQGIFCNWTWDTILCWPPTPAGVLARMHCPSGWHGVDTRKFANRKCELDGHWGGRPNETEASHNGWTDYQPCFKPEVNLLMQQIKNVDLYVEIAQRTRTLEIVGLILSLLALIISLVIFCNFRSLRNNRTKIHKNLFIAMVLQVIVRLTLYLDQAFRRGKQEAATNSSLTGIENTLYLCEASYVLLEYARTAMFMWMFIEGLYLHNMVTVAVFQGNFPHKIFSLLGWGMPVLMTTIWALCTAIYMDTALGDCLWNYNLTPYYWILEGPRLVVILLNFVFLVNIISVLVVKLRQSQASDIEQTRKAVRAAIVLLPLLGITNLLHLVPDLQTPWKFALWSYVTHFLTSFQGFFIALIYCFLNGEVRAVLFKSLAVYMSVRGHSEWVPKRASMYSAAYNTAPDTDALQQQTDSKRVSPPNRRLNSRKASCASIIMTHNAKYQQQNHQNINIEQQQQQQNHQLQFSNETQRLTTPTNIRHAIVSRSNSPNNNNKNAAIVMENVAATTSSGLGGSGGVGGTSNVKVTLIQQQKKKRRFFNNGIASRNRSRSNNVIHSDNSIGNDGIGTGNRRGGNNGEDNGNWMITLCFRGQKVLRVPPASSVPPESVVFELSEQ